jgi:nitrite reductase/ring-hydroxylating ferredoxin subunit
VFKVEGRVYALLNRCPHKGAELCRGDVIDPVVSDFPGDVRLESGMKLLACPLHGWEYDMETGQSWFDPVQGRARPFDVQVQAGSKVATAIADGTATVLSGKSGAIVDPVTHRIRGPYTAEVFPVEVQDEYLVVSLTGLRTGREE